MGWGAVFDGELEIHEIPAHHQNIMIEPNVGLLAQQLTACVDRARRGPQRAHTQSRDYRPRPRTLEPSRSEQLVVN